MKDNFTNSRQSPVVDRTGHAPSLWRDAPAWRALVTAAAVFALSAASLALVGLLRPSAMSASAIPGAVNGTCDAVPVGRGGEGKIVRFQTAQETLAMLENTQARLHSDISPAYITNPRVVLEVNNGGTKETSIAFVPEGLIVKEKDHVMFKGGEADPTLPCHYIPSLITRVIP